MRNKGNEKFQSGKVYKVICKILGEKEPLHTVHTEKKPGTVVNHLNNGWPTKITRRAHCPPMQQVTNQPRTTSKTLHASLASVKVSVCDSTTPNIVGKSGSNVKITVDQKRTKRL